MSTTRFGQRLRELRLDRRMNQRDLATQVGIDVTYLSKVETGRMDPPAEDTVRKLAAALGEDPTELLTLAKKVPSEVRDVVTGTPEVSHFLRTAKDFTPAQWRLLKKVADSGKLQALLDAEPAE